jgi:hypothetical protein
MIHLMLRQAGRLVDYRRVDRLYRLENVQVCRRKREKIPVTQR